jgi:hypothetical protein
LAAHEKQIAWFMRMSADFESGHKGPGLVKGEREIIAMRWDRTLRGRGADVVRRVNRRPLRLRFRRSPVRMLANEEEQTDYARPMALAASAVPVATTLVS